MQMETPPIGAKFLFYANNICALIITRFTYVRLSRYFCTGLLSIANSRLKMPGSLRAYSLIHTRSNISFVNEDIRDERGEREIQLRKERATAEKLSRDLRRRGYSCCVGRAVQFLINKRVPSGAEPFVLPAS